MSGKAFTIPATYHVTISDAYWEQKGNQGDPKFAMIANLIGQCMIDGEAYEGKHQLYFNSTIVSAGTNAGKRMSDLNADALCKLGMPRPFDPSQLEHLVGVECDFCVQEETYNNKKYLKVKYANPLLNKVESKDAVKAAFAGLFGPTVVGIPAQPLPGMTADGMVTDENGEKLF